MSAAKKRLHWIYDARSHTKTLATGIDECMTASRTMITAGCPRFLLLAVVQTPFSALLTRPRCDIQKAVPRMPRNDGKNHKICDIRCNGKFTERHLKHRGFARLYAVSPSRLGMEFIRQCVDCVRNSVRLCTRRIHHRMCVTVIAERPSFTSSTIEPCAPINHHVMLERYGTTRHDKQHLVLLAYLLSTSARA